jgi:hypothetical protein
MVIYEVVKGSLDQTFISCMNEYENEFRFYVKTNYNFCYRAKRKIIIIKLINNELAIICQKITPHLLPTH